MEHRLNLPRWWHGEPDWWAAAVAGFAAGAVLMVLELLWAALMSSAGPWRISQLIAALVLGPGTLQPSAVSSFSLPVVAVALATHYAAGVVFGMAAAFIGAGFHYDTRPTVMAAMGALFGAALYVFSFHIATLVFPWLAELRGWSTVAAHLIFGSTGALMYWQLARRPVKSQSGR